MRLICTVLLFSLLSVCTIPSFSKSRASGTPVDLDYLLALSTADHFLQAWQTRDEEASLLILTDHIRQRTREDQVRSFFSSPTCPRTSYEIGRGRKRGSDRYEFPVALFQPSSRNGQKGMRPLTSTLTVVRSGKSEWAIDNLP